MDLSEMLDRRLAKDKDQVANTAGHRSSAQKASKKVRTESLMQSDDDDNDDDEVNLDEDEELESDQIRDNEYNLRSFKPSLQDLRDAEADQDGDKSEDAEDEDSEVEEEDDDDDDMEDEDIDSEQDFSDEDDPERLAKLEQLISGLASQTSSQKRALDSGDSAAESGEGIKKKRRTLLHNERTEAVPEGEFAAAPGAGSGSGGKLTLDAMLSSLTGSGSASVEALKKSLRPLSALSSPAASDSPFEAEYARLTADEAALLARERAKKADSKKRKTAATGALPAPLAPLHQAKVERKAAKEKQEEEVKKWEETVNRMRGVAKDGADDPEARLILPLQTQGKGKGTSSAELVAKFAVRRPGQIFGARLLISAFTRSSTALDLISPRMTSRSRSLPLLLRQACLPLHSWQQSPPPSCPPYPPTLPRSQPRTMLLVPLSCV